jgi:hypothetical protein
MVMPMKAKKSVREEIKRPDPIQAFFADSIAWVRQNKTRCIAIVVIVIVAGGAGWGYGFYRNSKVEKAQYLLAVGMRAYQEYAVNPQGDALARSEGSFGQAAKVGPAGVRDVARLYLAKIALIKGSKEQARRLYSELSRSASSDVVRKLSDAALQDLDRKSQAPAQKPQ